MRTIFIECNMGAAGDMLMAALSEISDNSEQIISKLNSFHFDGLKIEKSKCEKCGILGTQIKVSVNDFEETSDDFNTEHEHNHEHHHEHGHEHHHEHEHEHEHNHEHNHEHHHEHEHNHEHEHHHSDLLYIKNIINNLNVSETVKKNAIDIYQIIAAAEAKVHGKPVAEVHFHEVGAIDAIVDIVGCCLFIEDTNPANIIVSPIETGSGMVKCAHGILPVPAPATAEILKGLPILSKGIKGELCTPTGAAILKFFANKFSNQPIMKVEKIGYGMGKKDFESANCVRIFLGDTERQENNITCISCNIDDMTGEELGYAAELIIQQGALDVFITPILMKKGRPAYTLSCLCEPENSEKFAILILKQTSTFGVRMHECKRFILDREFITRDSEYGAVRIKKGSGYGMVKEKAEFDDIARIAREKGINFRTVLEHTFTDQNNE